MAISMNSINNRSEDRFNLLYNLLDITDVKDKGILTNTITEVNSMFFSSDHISGFIDGNG